MIVLADKLASCPLIQILLAVEKQHGSSQNTYTEPKSNEQNHRGQTDQKEVQELRAVMKLSDPFLLARVRDSLLFFSKI